MQVRRRRAGSDDLFIHRFVAGHRAIVVERLLGALLESRDIFPAISDDTILHESVVCCIDSVQLSAQGRNCPSLRTDWRPGVRAEPVPARGQGVRHRLGEDRAAAALLVAALLSEGHQRTRQGRQTRRSASAECRRVQLAAQERGLALAYPARAIPSSAPRADD